MNIVSTPSVNNVNHFFQQCWWFSSSIALSTSTLAHSDEWSTIRSALLWYSQLHINAKRFLGKGKEHSYFTWSGLLIREVHKHSLALETWVVKNYQLLSSKCRPTEEKKIIIYHQLFDLARQSLFHLISFHFTHCANRRSLWITAIKSTLFSIPSTYRLNRFTKCNDIYLKQQ